MKTILKQQLIALAITIASIQTIQALDSDIKRAHQEREDLTFMILPSSTTTKFYKPNASIGNQKFTPFGLEIRNKTGKPVWIAVANEEKNTRKTSPLIEVEQNDPLKPVRWIGLPEKPLKINMIPTGESGAFVIDTAFNTAIAIWQAEEPATEVLIERNYDQSPIDQIWFFKPDPDLVIQTGKSDLSKTLYLTLDKVEPRGVRPQRGPNLGLSGRTETGLSLNNNTDGKNLKYYIKRKKE